MNISKNTLNTLIKEYEGDDLAGHIVDILNTVGNIKAKLISLRREKGVLFEKHEKELKELDTKIQDVQKSCKHIETHYNCDPAGGSDGYSECSICGATGKQLKGNGNG